MRQEKTGEPTSGGELSEPVEDRIKNGIEEKGKGAYHNHYLENHYDKEDYTGKRRGFG
jgi:hypothetical protein